MTCLTAIFPFDPQAPATWRIGTSHIEIIWSDALCSCMTGAMEEPTFLNKSWDGLAVCIYLWSGVYVFISSYELHWLVCQSVVSITMSKSPLQIYTVYFCMHVFVMIYPALGALAWPLTCHPFQSLLEPTPRTKWSFPNNFGKEAFTSRFNGVKALTWQNFVHKQKE